LDKFLTFTLIGLSTGAIYAIIASGLVLTYTTTGIFNFAQGAIGMICAFAFWQMYQGWGWSVWLAAAVALLVVAPLLGAAIDALVMRGLEDTTEVTKLVVSIGLLVGLIGLANWIWKPGVSRIIPQFFAGSGWSILSTRITGQQVLTIGVAIVVALALWIYLRTTRMGVAMRAVVDDRPLAALNGARPNRVSTIAWGMGCTLAAIGGILIAPNVPFDAATLSLLIVNAYAAAIIGRLRSLPLTFLGAAILGCTEAYLSGYLKTSPNLAGLRLAAPAILLFIVLLIIPASRLRGRRQSREFFPMPTWRGAWIFAGCVVLAGLIMATTMDASHATTYSLVFTFSLFALSLVPLIGFAGQISLATLTFGAIGALLYSHHGTNGSPVGLVLAFVVPALVGALIALPALRLSGIYLALGTAAFAVALDRWIFNLGDFDLGPIHISLFRLGSTEVAPLSLLGYRFDTPWRLTMLVAVAFALASLLVVAVRRSRYGRRLLAMKSSEAACATLGLDLVGTKLTVFALSAGIAGVAGALYGMQLRSISPQNFSFVNGLPVLLLAVVGGIGAIGGALMAGFSLMGVLPLIATLGVFFANLSSVLPGLAGIGLGRNPNGSVHDMREGFAPILRYRPAIIGIAVAVPVLWALRLAGVLGNATFYWLLALTPIAAVVLAAVKVGTGDGTEDEDTPTVDHVPLEWKGFAVPWEADDVEELDRALGMNEVQLHGAP
jgi:branched-chain amino acid transport system permease protein